MTAMQAVPVPPAARPIALVTGGSSGLGAALCAELAGRGWHVLAASRRGTVPGAALPGGAGLIEPLALDVCRQESISDLARRLDHQGQMPELLVNNAGINISGVFEELSAAQSRAILDTNFHGVADCIRAFLPAMRARRRGTILTIGSLAGLLAPPGEACYAASKHALEGLHEALQHELHRFGIRLCLAEPGFIRTALAHSAAAPEYTVADYAALREVLRAHWTASVAGGMSAERAARDIVGWTLEGKGLRRRFGDDARRLPWLKALLPESAFAAGLRRRFGI
ncbi:MAG: SDR family NAD(P)-dependent oxidoreductase [Rubrivivax sp.]|nr:SDR family NAD(P)-dependent oxidoreductase [Rubrivivax sp.]